MGMKLFDDDDDNDNDNVDVSNIEIDKEFARRYDHNKKREALQRYEELKKKGQIEDSDSQSDSESTDEEVDADIIKLSKKENLRKFIENLNKVKKRDPSLYNQDSRLFDSDSDSESESDNDDDSNIDKKEGKDRKKKAKYLKDVMAQQLLEEGPEFDDVESSSMKKTYNEEQDELKKAFLDAVKDAEMDTEGDLLKVKEKKNGNDVKADDGEFEKKLGEYFGPETELDENNKFLKDFFEKQMWVDRGSEDRRRGFVDDDEVDELLRDEEEIEKQEKYEESYNFRYEENAGDRVMGHSRKVEGSVRKKENARKEQRKSKEERMKIVEMQRKEEVKHLKNLKKQEMKEKLMKVMEAAGIRDDNDFVLDLNDLEEDFDPSEYDKLMKKAFGEEYYNADDVDPGFGSNNDDDKADDDVEKPDFDKEDELLGLPKGWEAVDNSDGFLAARERFLKKKAEEEEEEEVEEEEEEEEEEEDEEEEEEEEKEKKEKKEIGNAVEQNEESKRKRKRKMSAVKKVKEELMEEYYKLDYEGTVGDLKTRFKYAKVHPNRYGLKTEEILMLDDRELNQYVSVKKLVPYKEREWKVPDNKRFQQKMWIRELMRGRLNHLKTNKKNRSKVDGDKSTSSVDSHQDGQVEFEESNVKKEKLSRQAKRRRRQAELKLPASRLVAYQNIQSKAKGKRKH
ncbi:hypothetical protein JCGZ_18041 [Jatropha curcas]|uniref:Kri1-like C-terminal domain-containing protein n=1 Tax=Jatropha curcas TaxID=180498 RepID=A0A067JVQ1_JATCU|nr:hypothetical protein JCGZ_18041 [Jatropha curcas]